MITNDALKFITIQALKTLEKDVLFLEAFVSKLQVNSSDSFNCSDSFTELRQVCSFIDVVSLVL